VATLIRNQVKYFVRDEACLGRGCLDLGESKPVLDGKGTEVRSACRRMLQKGCPRELPKYDTQVAAKHGLSGVSVFHEPIQTRTLPVPCPDATFVNRDATIEWGC
jgi:hypothetical protein